MDKVNFINSLPEKKYLSFYNWLRISSILIIFLFIVIIFLHAKKSYELAQLNKSKLLLEQKLSVFDDTVKEKNKAEIFRQDIEKQLTKIQNRSSVTNKSLAYNILTQIARVIPDDIYLKNFEYNSKQEIKLKGITNVSQSVANFVKKLSKLEIIQRAKIIYIKAKHELTSEDNDEEIDLPILHEFLISVKIKK